MARSADSADAGFGIIEVIVSLLILGLVVLPTTRLVMSTTDSTSQLHFRTEAIDLASKDLETVEYQLSLGVTPSIGSTTSTVHIGSDQFTEVTDFEELAGAGSGNTLCTASGSSVASTKIGQITATVGWETGGTGLHKGDEVVERTLYAPAQENFDASLNGEIAIPVDLYPSGTSDTTVPVNITLTADSCTSSCSVIPSGDTTSGSANTGSTGCAVFTDLDPNYTYNATFVNNPGYVDSGQLSDSPTASGDPTITNIPTTAGSVYVTSPYELGAGSSVTVSFQPKTFAGVASPSTPMPSELPITVLQPAVSTVTTVTLGGSSAFATASGSAQTALLFPAGSTTIWAGDSDANQDGGSVTTTLTSGSTTSVTVPLVVVPLTVSGAATSNALQFTDGGTISFGVLSGSTSVALPAGSYTLTETGSTISPLYLTVTSKGTCSGSTSKTVSACFNGTGANAPSTASVAVS